MIPVFALEAGTGELIRPRRFLPAIDWEHEHTSLALGPWEVESGVSEPDMTRGNYGTGWAAYVLSGGATFMQKKLPNGVWDGAARQLLTLTDALQKISLEFSPSGHVILGYLRADQTMGIWWRDPVTGLPALLELDDTVQDVLISVENKDDPDGTDVFLWYFKGGELLLRLYSENFATVHGPYVTGVSSPIILQAGINHRYGYQVDYRDNA